jgi:WhiB family redox-sensing transcriptional regulator
MATTLRIDVADQPNHRKGRKRRKEMERGWTDEVLQMDLLSTGELTDAARRAVSVRAAGIALTHPCRARRDPRRRCRHPGHAGDVERLRDWLEHLGLLPGEVAEPEPEPEPKVAVRHRRRDWSWTEDAACRGEDVGLFYPPDGQREPERDVRERKAKRVCRRCPVAGACFEWALAEREQGVWGGTTEEERVSERRRRARLARLEAEREEAS